jgi:hypothetical protein
MQLSVDLNGRVIPTGSERVYSTTDRRYFCLEQPKLDLPAIYQRFVNFFGTDPFVDLDSSEFTRQVEQLKSEVQADSSLSNLLQGIYVPFFLPKLALFKDSPLKQLVVAAGRSFEDSYPNFEFRFLADNDLDAMLELRQDSRWENIYKIWTERSVVGLYFPTALSGFAIPDHTVALSRLAKNFILSGIPEAASAFVGTPGLLMKSDGKYPNLLALTAFLSKEQSQSHMFYFFEAYGWNLYFNKRSQIGAVSEYYSGGISVIAQ